MSESDKTRGPLRPQPPKPQDPMGRRAFFRGVTDLAVGGLGVSALAGRSAWADSSEPAAAQPALALSTQTERILRWAGPYPRNWVKAHPGADHNVVIVGGGQTGVSIAHALRRKGVGQVDVIDQAEPGQAGIWRTIARMKTLRTPKTLTGPEQGDPALGFRAWYETLHGPSAFDALNRIPRLAWADYLAWFQQVTKTQVRYRTRLLRVEPAGDLLKLHLTSAGVARTETTRKLVLANGYTGAGGPNIPDILRALPQTAWTHTASPIDFAALAGKVVGVIGAGPSAFDAAAVALESGAREVHLFSRRAYIGYPQSAPASPAPDLGHASLVELAYELPDVVRWRDELARVRSVVTVPVESIQRAVAFRNFYVHVNSPWSAVALTSRGKVVATIAGRRHRFDHVIAGTGYRVDLSLQPELAGIYESIALWRDRFHPAAGEDNAVLGIYPYLGSGFEFLPRKEGEAGFLRNIHCFNLAATVSFEAFVGDVPSVVLQPRLVSAIARDLYVADVNIAANERFANTPRPPQDPGPYRRALRT